MLSESEKSDACTTTSEKARETQFRVELWDFYAAMDLPVDGNGDWLGWVDGKTIVEAFERLPEIATALDKLKWLAMVEANIRALRADAMIAEREKRRVTNQA